jgi:PadR family transcriptional regulator PadR
VRSSLGVRTGLLLALLQGPGYGLDLIERVRGRTGGRIRLRQGGVYPALRDLERRKLVRSWTVKPPRSGRPRRYYELTPKGVTVAYSHREAVAGLTTSETGPAVSRRELRAMRERLLECAEVTEAARWLRRAGEAAGR